MKHDRLHKSKMNVRSMTMDELYSALHMNICHQHEWSRAIEQVLYFGKEAPPGFLVYGKECIWERQERVEAIEMELDRRQRLELFKTFYDQICKQDAT